MQGLNNFIDYVYSKAHFAALEGVQTFINDLDNMHLFYNKMLDSTQPDNSTNEIRQINAPFQNVWIENINLPVNILKTELTLDAIGILEFSPIKQMIYFACSDNTQNTLYCACFSITNNALGFGFTPNKLLQSEYEKTCHIVYSWLLMFEKQLKKENIHYLQNDKRLVKKGRIKGIYKKTKYKPKDIIYISKKSNITADPTLSKKIINKPQYAYEVMGHWRKINSIGKDRNGNRIIDGFTWVNPYQKGTGELMKKVRIINESEFENVNQTT